MHGDLEAARSLAKSVRFSGEIPRQNSFNDPSQTRAFADANYQSGLRISSETTPRVASELAVVLQRLSIPATVVEAFVFASADIAANCFTGSTSKCVIRFSSQLIENLRSDEFRFVVGHELGHFLLDHGFIKDEQRKLSLEYFMQLRAQEISVDRLGLIACGSLESAMRALMKTISGLSDHHLKFDVGAFVSQLRRSSATLQAQESSASHPSLVFRSRALLWFSMSEHFNADVPSFPSGCLDEMDGYITRDLERFVDGPVRRRIEQARQDFAIWTVVTEIVSYGSFEREKQEKFAETFGEDTLRQVKEFLSTLEKSEIDEVVYNKLRTARENLEDMIPTGFADEIKDIGQMLDGKVY